MDAESLKSAGWLVVWGGLFYVMMRYGCGAHMMGRPSHGGQGDTGSGSGAVKDPVCGLTIDLKGTAAAAVRGGTTYYFCSVSCRDRFEQTPDRYIGASAQASHPHGGHHHG